MKKLILLLMVFFTISIISGCKTATVNGGPVNIEHLNDGVYEGYSSFGPNKARVKVAIQDQKIIQVELLEHDAWKGHKADEIIPKRIVDKQSTQVDAVSGATNSSNVMMNAVQNAIEKAYGESNSEAGDSE